MHRSRVKIIAFLAVSVFLAVACQAHPAAPTAPPVNASGPDASPEASPSSSSQAQHVIGIRQVDNKAEFFNRRTGETFYPRGANYVFVPTGSGSYSNLTLQTSIYNPDLIRSDFQKMANLGYNIVRVFIDQCSEGPGCITRLGTPGLNPDYMDNLADMMQAARQAGIFILFTSNDLPDGGGYADEANQGSGGDFSGYRNSYYLRPNAISATRRYWRDILSALIERGAAFDAVLGWQLLNEQWMFADQPPLSLTEGMVETTTGRYDLADPLEKQQMVADGLVYYIDQMKEEILLHDPTALVTMGFFTPRLVAPGWYVETAPLLERSDLDFFDFHLYPGEFSYREMADAFGMIGYEEKPVILGEYGAFRHIYSLKENAAQIISRWAAESCAYEFDGWLYWAYYPANPEVGDRTWGLTDEDDYLLNLLAPLNQPDICTAVKIETGNIAWQKPVSASRSLPDEPPENAVDENPATQWGAGADASQWIEVDLQGSFRVKEIRLLVSQYPAGKTSHEVQVQLSGESRFATIHQFSQETKDNDWLVYIPDSPLENVSSLRVLTTASPSWVSWKELQVFGEAMAP